jgi:cell division protein FtsB
MDRIERKMFQTQIETLSKEIDELRIENKQLKGQVEKLSRVGLRKKIARLFLPKDQW